MRAECRHAVADGAGTRGQERGAAVRGAGHDRAARCQAQRGREPRQHRPQGVPGVTTSGSSPRRTPSRSSQSGQVRLTGSKPSLSALLSSQPGSAPLSFNCRYLNGCRLRRYLTPYLRDGDSRIDLKLCRDLMPEEAAGGAPQPTLGAYRAATASGGVESHAGRPRLGRCLGLLEPEQLMPGLPRLLSRFDLPGRGGNAVRRGGPEHAEMQPTCTQPDPFA